MNMNNLVIECLLSVVKNITGTWPTVVEHRDNWVFVDLIWFSVPIVDAAIYARTYSSRPRSKRAVRPPPLPPAPLPSSLLSIRLLDSSNPQRESSHLSAAWTTGLTNLLQLSKTLPTTQRIAHVFYMFIKTSSGRQVNGTVLFFFFFSLQNQWTWHDTRQLFPGSCRAPFSDCIILTGIPANLWARLLCSLKYLSRSTAHPL